MKEGVKLWCFILLIPFFLAIAHDLYANYYLNPVNKVRLEAFDIDPKAYQVSDTGYLFMRYTPEAFETTRNALGEEFWVRWVDPVLRLYTYVVALIPAVLFFIWLIVSKFVDDILPGRRMTVHKSEASPDKFRRKDGGVKYTRR